MFIDYILALVAKYHESNCEDKEVLVTIRKAVDASPQLRSKKQLIEEFIARVNEIEDVMAGWEAYVKEQREKDLAEMIAAEKLKPDETRAFLEKAFREGEVKTVGTDIDKLMPPVSRFNKSNRPEKKQTIIDKLRAFFEKYSGIGESSLAEEPDNVYRYAFSPEAAELVAQPESEYGEQNEDGSNSSR